MTLTHFAYQFFYFSHFTTFILDLKNINVILKQLHIMSKMGQQKISTMPACWLNK